MGIKENGNWDHQLLLIKQTGHKASSSLYFAVFDKFLWISLAIKHKDLISEKKKKKRHRDSSNEAYKQEPSNPVFDKFFLLKTQCLISFFWWIQCLISYTHIVPTKPYTAMRRFNWFTFHIHYAHTNKMSYTFYA